jgi:FixJ family two-component response regulator
MNHKILFVDDEVNILKALQRLMRKSAYETDYVSSGKEALEKIRRTSYSVIVTDMRMPEMSGVELVRKANEKDRMSVKIVLSGYSDIEDIMSAINGGHIHSYITKPWKDTDLMIALMNACEMFERRLREKEMLEELRLKNEELNELNENLEKLVEARTREIKASNMLLNSILKGAGEEEVLGQGMKILSKMMGGNGVAIRSLMSETCYSSNPEHAAIDPSILEKLKVKKQALHEQGALFLPLFGRSALLGVIAVFTPDKTTPEALKRMNTFISGIKLFLSQQEALAASSEVMGSIDMLIEEADAPA